MSKNHTFLKTKNPTILVDVGFFKWNVVVKIFISYTRHMFAYPHQPIIGLRRVPLPIICQVNFSFSFSFKLFQSTNVHNIFINTNYFGKKFIFCYNCYVKSKPSGDSSLLSGAFDLFFKSKITSSTKDHSSIWRAVINF
jgi:hypothetical protein